MFDMELVVRISEKGWNMFLSLEYVYNRDVHKIIDVWEQDNPIDEQG